MSDSPSVSDSPNVSDSPLPVDPRGRGRALGGLLLALAVGDLPIAHWLVAGDSMAHKLAGEAIFWCCALAVILWLTAVERLPLSSIGFRRPTWKNAGLAILAALVTTGIMVLQFAVIIPALHLDASRSVAVQQTILRTPFWYRFLLVLRAAVMEEIVFRGYMIEKVRQLTGSTTLALLVSIAAFTYAHLRGWGPVQLIPVAGAAVVLGLFYIWRRDLPANMLAHFLTDAAGFLAQ